MGTRLSHLQLREYQARTAIEDLEDLNGIGSATAEKLGDAGVDSLAALREADPDIVATEVQGVSATQVRDWQDDWKPRGPPVVSDERHAVTDRTLDGVRRRGCDCVIE